MCHTATTRRTRSSVSATSLLPPSDKITLWRCTEKDCGKTFQRYSDLKRHGPVHTNVKAFKCRVCHRGFKQKAGLSIHMNSHTGARPYNCDQCGSTFGDPSSANRHREEKHSLPFVCNLMPCNKKTKRRVDFLKHLRDLHGMTEEEVEGIDLDKLRADVPRRGRRRVRTQPRRFRPAANYFSNELVDQPMPSSLLQTLLPMPNFDTSNSGEGSPDSETLHLLTPPSPTSGYVSPALPETGQSTMATHYYYSAFPDNIDPHLFLPECYSNGKHPVSMQTGPWMPSPSNGMSLNVSQPVRSQPGPLMAPEYASGPPQWTNPWDYNNHTH